MKIRINACALKHPFNSAKRRTCQRRADLEEAKKKAARKNRKRGISDSRKRG